MRTLRTTRLLTVLAAASLVTGCLSTGVRNRDVDADREDDDSRPREVQGTVEHIDPLNHRIDIAQGEKTDRGDRHERRGDLAIYYDQDTLLEHETRHFRPQDLRRGDQIRAEVEPTAAGLIVQRIEVFAGERGGQAPERMEAPEAREAPEVRAAPEPPAAPELRDDSRYPDRLRGIVRYVDISAHTVEIEAPAGNGRSGRVRVQYDAETAVEFQGKSFSPENLQLGDRVEIALRDHGEPPLARQIVIVTGEQTDNH